MYLTQAEAGAEVHFIEEKPNGIYGCFYLCCSWLQLFFLVRGDIFDGWCHFCAKDFDSKRGKCRKVVNKIFSQVRMSKKSVSREALFLL
jgi:hypothetical protein